MNAFTLGRMRHLDLLALWHQLNPDMHEHQCRWAAQLSKEQIARLILSTA